MKRLLLILFCISCTLATQAQIRLINVPGSHSVGIRAGIGTINKYSFGLTYSYNFTRNLSLVIELDREIATFGNTDFVNNFLLSPGIEYTIWQPSRWMYLHAALHGCIGHDRWRSRVVPELETRGMVYGVSTGLALELFPVPFLSTVIKAQQYMLFGNGDHYFKPNFSLALRYNFRL